MLLLKDCLKKMGKDMAWLEKQTDIPEPTLYRYSRGFSMPPPKRVVRITEALGGQMTSNDFVEVYRQYQSRRNTRVLPIKPHAVASA